MPDRTSVLPALRLNVLLAVGGLFGYDTANSLQPVPQPERVEQRTYAATMTLTRENAVEEVLQGLATLEDLREFLEKETEEAQRNYPHTFLWRYRQSPASLRECGWVGNCNSFAEFAASWSFMHGGVPYIISLCPDGYLGKLYRPWHQMTVCKLRDERLVIFTGREITVWEKGNLQDYIKEQYPGKMIAPEWGCFRWRKVQDDPRAKFLQHALEPPSTEEEMERADLPMKQTTHPQGPVA